MRPFQTSDGGTLSLCKVLSIKDNVVEADEIDAAENSPIIALTPFTPGNDAAPHVKLPKWARPTGDQR